MDHHPPPPRLGRDAGAKELWEKEIGERRTCGEKRLKRRKIGKAETEG